MNEEGEPNNTTWNDNFSCIPRKVFCYYVIMVKRFFKGNGRLFNLSEDLLIWEPYRSRDIYDYVRDRFGLSHLKYP